MLMRSIEVGKFHEGGIEGGTARQAFLLCCGPVQKAAARPARRGKVQHADTLNLSRPHQGGGAGQGALIDNGECRLRLPRRPAQHVRFKLCQFVGLPIARPGNAAFNRRRQFDALTRRHGVGAAVQNLNRLLGQAGQNGTIQSNLSTSALHATNA